MYAQSVATVSERTRSSSQTAPQPGPSGGAMWPSSTRGALRRPHASPSVRRSREAYAPKSSKKSVLSMQQPVAGMPDPVEMAGTVQFDVCAVELGEVGQFAYQGEAMAYPCAQPVGGALDEPLGG